MSFASKANDTFERLREKMSSAVAKKGTGGTGGPKLLHQLTGHHSGPVNGVAYIDKIGSMPGGIISVSEDKHLMIFLSRDNNQYWPSVAETLPSGGSALFVNTKDMLAFVGTATGAILIYKIVEDYNAVKLVSTISAHSDRVTGIHVDSTLRIVISCGRDKRFCVHRLSDNSLLSDYNLESWGTTLQYDSKSPNAFIADYSGRIHVLKLDKSNEMKISVVAVLEGHEGSIRSLDWQQDVGFLFSGSFDNTIKVWDIGGYKGNCYTLRAHKGKIKGLAYVPESKQLISAGTDKMMIVWSMADGVWKSVPEWSKSEVCQLCSEPFFWNVSKMWEEKKFAMNRQHHCRYTGMAVCDTCSPHRIIVPEMGFETKVRVSIEAEPQVKDRTPRAKAFPLKAEVLVMKTITIEGKLALITASTDGNISIWGIKDEVLDAKGVGVNEFIAAPTTGSGTITAEDYADNESDKPVASLTGPTVYSTGADLEEAPDRNTLLDDLDD
eukprot:m.32205 g.32205  ORF g.32205 m.32205 type:complete len:495 (-) comp16601_c0_seq2:247-1731(-)